MDRMLHTGASNRPAQSRQKHGLVPQYIRILNLLLPEPNREWLWDRYLFVLKGTKRSVS